MESAFGVEHTIAKGWGTEAAIIGGGTAVTGGLALHGMKRQQRKAQQARRNNAGAQMVAGQLAKNPAMRQTGPRSFVAKGVPKGLLKAVAKMPKGRGGAPFAATNSTVNPRHAYLAERVAAHAKGKEAARYASVPKQYRNQGLPQHHLLNQTRSSGMQAKNKARLALGAG